MRTKFYLTGALLVAALMLVGCGSDSSTGISPSNTIALRLVVDPSTDNTVVDPLARILPLTEGAPDRLTINSWKFLVRSVQFKNVSDYTIDTDISAADEQRDGSDLGIPFQGPFVLSKSGGTTMDLGTQSVLVGDYNALSLILYEGKVTDDLGQHTDMVGRSAKITGVCWYGDHADPFDFTINLQTEILVGGGFAVPAAGSPEYVLEFDLGKWFQYGDKWLNPNEVENLPLIYKNIQRQISGGRDYDGDGVLGD